LRCIRPDSAYTAGLTGATTSGTNLRQ
jgi:hypothetical protein